MPSAIPLERKHKTLMQYADAIQDTRSGVYDGSVLREVLNRQLAHLERAEWLDLDEGLVRPRKPPRAWLNAIVESFGVNDYLVSRVANFKYGSTCSRCDVVALIAGAGLSAARVYFHAACDGVLFTCVGLLAKVESNLKFSVWRDMETLHFVALGDIIDTLVFADDGCGVITVLHPLGIRS